MVEQVDYAATHFDPNKGVKFSTYLYPFINFAALKWAKDYHGIGKDGERYISKAADISIEAPGTDAGRTIGDELAEQIAAPDPDDVRPSFAEVANSANLTTKERDILIGLAAFKGSMADYARSIGVEPNAIRQAVHRVRARHQRSK